mmetsp:Transcript_10258/g.42960  ORF Transcript_10258/g.42960 Transcript_10258/m.42960 type:complete len:86 (-) Transcript_10258:439-696(-)
MTLLYLLEDCALLGTSDRVTKKLSTKHARESISETRPILHKPCASSSRAVRDREADRQFDLNKREKGEAGAEKIRIRIKTTMRRE